jgi:pimeloyl-ACP methyl ester carboxylesterase
MPEGRHDGRRGLNVFYREAGDPSAPTFVLLHGAPTSSFMFRNLIPLLEDRFHIIAPDLIAYGHSDAPSVTDFDYTFDSLTHYVNGLLEQLGSTGTPSTFRTTAHPSAGG